MSSEAEVSIIEIDVGDAPIFTVAVAPFAVDTAMTAVMIAPDASSTLFTMTPNTDKSIWDGAGPVLLVPGEHTAQFTITGTGLGVKYATVIAAVPPPMSQSVRRVRLLITDTNPAARIFRVDEIQDFLDLESGTVKLAAATALETIARSEALTSKVIKSQDLATDGAKLAAELRLSAAEMRRQVEASEGDPDTGFDVLDYTDPNTLSIWGADAAPW